MTAKCFIMLMCRLYLFIYVFGWRACLFLMNGEKVLGVYIESAGNRHRAVTFSHDPIILLVMSASTVIMTWSPDFASDLWPLDPWPLSAADIPHIADNNGDMSRNTRDRRGQDMSTSCRTHFIRWRIITIGQISAQCIDAQ